MCVARWEQLRPQGTWPSPDISEVLWEQLGWEASSVCVSGRSHPPNKHIHEGTRFLPVTESICFQAVNWLTWGLADASGKKLIQCSTSSQVPALRASSRPQCRCWGSSAATTSEETGLEGVSLFQRSRRGNAITVYLSCRTDLGR